METMISLMIAGNNQFMIEMLLEVFENYYDIDVVGVAKSNLKIVDLAMKLKPHIILLDTIEPGIREINILKEFNKIKKDNRPLFIVLSEDGNNEKIKNIIALGVKEYLIKPLGTDVLVTKIRQVFIEYYYFKRSKLFRNPDIIQEVNSITSELLYNIGILPHLFGYKYIKEAISYMVNNQGEYKPLNKVLYPLIAEEFGTTSDRVERCIRNAIKSAWKKNRNFDKSIVKESGILEMFDKKPTNSQFIVALFDLVKSNIDNTNFKK